MALVILIAVAACIAIGLAFRGWAWAAGGTLVGSTEASVRARYGQPDHESAGHYGLPELTWTQQSKGPIKTAVFKRLGGELYVTFENRNGQWIVISNSYLPRGGAF